MIRRSGMPQDVLPPLKGAVAASNCCNALQCAAAARIFGEFDPGFHPETANPISERGMR